MKQARGAPASAQEPAGLTGTSRRTEEMDCQLQRRIWFRRAGAGDSACLTCSQVTSKLLHLLVWRETYTSARIGPLDRKFLRLSETSNHVGRLLAPPTDTLCAWGPGTSPSGVWGPELTVEPPRSGSCAHKPRLWLRESSRSPTMCHHVPTFQVMGASRLAAEVRPAFVFLPKTYQRGELVVQTLMMVLVFGLCLCKLSHTQ